MLLVQENKDVIMMFGYDNKTVTVAGGLMLAIVLVAMGMSMLGDSGGGPPAEAGDSGGGIDPVGADPSSAQSAIEPVVETETPEEESGLKLLKKAGPFNFPSYGATDQMGMAISQKEEFDMLADKGILFSAGADSFRSLSVYVERGAADIVVIMILRDKEGNPVLCKWDEETRSDFSLKQTLHISPFVLREEAEYAVRGSNAKREMGNNIHSWEALVYG